MNHLQSYKVPETGFEPAHPFGRYHLKVVRLPISPPGQMVRGLRFDVQVINLKPQTSNLKHFRTANVSGLLFQYNSERRSFSRIRIFYKNFSFVILFNNAFGKTEPKSPAPFLCRKTRFKNFLLHR